MSEIYTSGRYLDANPTWHVEDSAWKAAQINAMIRRHALKPRRVAEIGCGAGAILAALAGEENLKSAEFVGYDISPQAIALAKSRQSARLQFHCADMFDAEPAGGFDLLLVIDVIEHVPDYMGFAEHCRRLATFKVFHIPLDMHASAVLRNSFGRVRDALGHLHYFTADTAIATLTDTGYEILDCVYTCGALRLRRRHPSLRTSVANVPRRLLSALSTPFTARTLGGYSLLVLAQ